MLKALTGLFLLAVCFLAGCASTPEASPERDAEAKEFQTHPGTAGVYVYRVPADSREEESVLFLDGRIVGQTLPGAYFRIDVAPGRHVLHGTGIDQGKLALDARPDALYFVELTVLAGHSQFRLVSEKVGRARIGQCCARLENWAPGQRPLLR